MTQNLSYNYNCREVKQMEENTVTLLLKIILNGNKLSGRAIANVLKDIMPIMFHPHVEKVEVAAVAQRSENIDNMCPILTKSLL